MNATMHSEIDELLPWHAAGTLSRRDAQRIEEALAQDSELTRRYALVRGELGETIHLNETLAVPSARAMELLFAKIDAEPARKPKASFGLAARLGGWLAVLSPRARTFAGSAAMLVVLLQSGVITGMLLKEGPIYVPQEAAGTSQGAFVLIGFAPQATQESVTTFLEANKLQIADGPLPGGFYKVQVAATELPKADIARIVDKLKNDKMVAFLLPLH